MRLELSPIVGAGLSLLFQFHKGAIRTGYGGTLGVLSVEFQFHKGAIRTMMAAWN